jgi:hypothetical protein
MVEPLPSRRYDWRSVAIRDAWATGIALFSMVEASDLRRHTWTSYCRNGGWHEAISYFVQVCIAILTIEAMNWVSWVVTDWLPESVQDASAPQAASPATEGRLIAPGGWIGIGMGVLLAVVVPRVLGGPSPCEPIQRNRISTVYVAATLGIAYGLLTFVQAIRESKK